MKKRLENYLQLVSRVDQLCKSAQEALHVHLSCAEGCSSCCKSISLFSVEAAAICAAVAALPEAKAESVRNKAKMAVEGDVCPLLLENLCLVYAFRPIICRTHGLPIMFTDQGERRVDYCPKNLQDCKTLPGSAVIDLDRLNELLVAVNLLFIAQGHSKTDPSERVTITEAVLGKKIFHP